MKDNIFENVPHSLRLNEIGPDIASMAALVKSSDFDTFDDAIDYAVGAARLQKVMRGDEDNIKSSVFPVNEITDVRFFARKMPDENRYIGTKARLYFEDTKYKSDKIEMKNIDTEFMAGSSFRVSGSTFTEAAALSNAKIATFLALEGKGASIRKVHDDDKNSRFLGGISGPYGKPVFYSFDPLKKALPDTSSDQRDAIIKALANVGTTWYRGKQLKPFALSAHIIKDAFGDEMKRFFVDQVNEMKKDSYNLSDNDNFDRTPGINVVPFIEALADEL